MQKSYISALIQQGVPAEQAPIMANGARFADRLWLRVADMFIYAGTALIVAAVVAVAVVKNRRVKEKR